MAAPLDAPLAGNSYCPAQISHLQPWLSVLMFFLAAQASGCRAVRMAMTGIQDAHGSSVRFRHAVMQQPDLMQLADWHNDAVHLTQSLLNWKADSNSLQHPSSRDSLESWPQVVHMTSRDTDQTPAKLQACLDMNPGWQVRLMDDAGMDRDIAAFAPRLQPMIAALTVIERADVWRYLVVMALGGVYLDSDVQCTTPFSEWAAAAHSEVPVQVLVGVEMIEGPGYLQPVQVCQWAFASVPGHPFLAAVIDDVIAQFLLLRRWEVEALPDNGVLNLTGPWVFTHATLQWLGLAGAASAPGAAAVARRAPVVARGLALLPQQAFGYAAGGKPLASATFTPEVDEQHPQLAVHGFAGSWRRGPIQTLIV